MEKHQDLLTKLEKDKKQPLAVQGAKIRSCPTLEVGVVDCPQVKPGANQY